MAPTVYTPPVNTYIPIGSVTLSATASEVVFSSLPTSGYRDLVLIFSGQIQTNAVDAIAIQFNGVTTTTYSHVLMEGTGSGSGASSANGSISYIVAGISGTAQTDSIIHIMDYSATDKHKTTISRGNHAGNRTRAIAGRWANTAAINQIRVFVEGGVSFTIGSTFSLYAIAG